MIHRISKRIVNFLLFSNVINKEEIDVYTQVSYERTIRTLKNPCLTAYSNAEFYLNILAVV